ncbi:DUF3108 domain-containing protein [Mesorhizobium sp. AaZ16]|uniref:DUF3108 domain-containing protein n=1 Tax=Mesorhizobium sp. AaZ16 TaxID=3402289 RepID=UPI00374E5E33
MAGLFQAFLIALVVTVPAPRKGGLQSFTGDYSVTFLGIPVARSTFNSTFEGNSFSVKGVLSAAGLAQIFDDTQGSVSAAGRFAGNRTQPTAFRVDYTEGKKSKMTSIRFKGGAVARTENVPPLKKRGKSWVPLKDAHLQAVTDPLSATLVRADNLSEVCGRTIKIYDGELRFDLTLTHESTGTMAIDGWEGDGHLWRPLRAGRRLPQGPQGAGLSEKPQPHDDHVCATRHDRGIWPRPRHGRHPDRHDHRPGAEVRSHQIARPQPRSGDLTWGAPR